MYSNKRTTTYTNKFSDNIDYIKELIIESEAIIIGAGAGLSAAAGLTYSGKRFENNFSDFIEKYHFSDMYSGGFYRLKACRNFGLTGRDMYSLTDMQKRLTDCTKFCLKKLKTKIILYLRQTSIINFRKPALISKDYFIHRATMVYFNVASHVTILHMITKILSARW